MMPPRLRRTLVFLSLAALFASVEGCNKRRPLPSQPDITQAEADDLMKQFGAMVATDSGGWFVEVQCAFAAWQQWDPARPGGPAPGAPRDTAFRNGRMDWTVTYSSLDTLGSAHAGWDSTAAVNAGFSRGVGRLSLPELYGDYGHRSDTLFVEGLGSSTDTLSFDMSAGADFPVDSAVITLTMGAASQFYFMDNLVDYHIEMLKHPAATPSYPIAGEASITVLADVLRDATRGAFLRSLDAEIDVTFDGSPTPLATIRANIDNPVNVFSYRVNLKTGAVVRSP